MNNTSSQYSVAVKVNTTFKLSQILILICKFLEKENSNFKHDIYSRIFSDADFIMAIHKKRIKNVESNIENLNLLIALSKLNGNRYEFTEKRLIELFSIQKTSVLNYFEIVCLLFYIQNKEKYKNIKATIIDLVESKFKVDNDPFSKTELTLLFFDYIACPYINIESKRTIMRTTKYVDNQTPIHSIDQKINDIFDMKSWYINWDVNIDLELALKKKDWRSTY